MTRILYAVIALFPFAVALAGALQGSAVPAAGILSSQSAEYASRHDTHAVTQDELFAQRMEEGARIFGRVCASCHGPQGGGMIGPPLRQNVENVRGVVTIIIAGRASMPPVGADFSDREIASVAT